MLAMLPLIRSSVPESIIVRACQLIVPSLPDLQIDVPLALSHVSAALATFNFSASALVQILSDLGREDPDTCLKLVKSLNVDLASSSEFAPLAQLLNLPTPSNSSNGSTPADLIRNGSPPNVVLDAIADGKVSGCFSSFLVLRFHMLCASPLTFFI